jgi:membrane protein
MDVIDNVKAAIGASVWGASLAALPRHRRGAVKCLRIVHMLGREMVSGTLTLRAASLVFTTLLSLVPLLAVSFSLLKAFGVHNRLEEVLLHAFAPLGERGAEIATRIVQFVDQVRVGVLGGVGLVILLLTVLSLIQKVEAALNATWRVHTMRSFGERFSGYLSVLLVGPLLVFAAMGVIGTLMGTPLARELAGIEPFGTLLSWLSKLLPYAFVIAAFSFVYACIPNTRVRLSSALVGGTVAGVLWATAGWAFAAFVVRSPESNYTAIYSSFAIVFFFMLWVYIAWLILLVGGTVAFYYQYPQYLGVMPGRLKVSNRLRERLAMAIMLRVGECHRQGGRPPSAADLGEWLELPFELVEDTLDALGAERLLVLEEEPVSGYLPGRDIASIRLVDVLAAARRAHDEHYQFPEHLDAAPRAEALLDALESGAARALGDRTLRDVLEEGDAQPAEAAPGAVALKGARNRL